MNGWFPLVASIQSHVQERSTALMSILIRNARLISDGADHVADVCVEAEAIPAIGSGLRHYANRVIDAAGNYLIPGGMGVHTHLDAPVGGIVSSDDFETGTGAAAFGGTRYEGFAIRGEVVLKWECFGSAFHT